MRPAEYIEKFKNVITKIHHEFYYSLKDGVLFVYINAPFKGTYLAEIHDLEGKLIWSYQIQKDKSFTDHWMRPMQPLGVEENFILAVFRDGKLIASDALHNINDPNIDLFWLTDEDFQLFPTHGGGDESFPDSLNAEVVYKYQAGFYMRGDWDYLLADLQPFDYEAYRKITEPHRLLGGGLRGFNGENWESGGTIASNQSLQELFVLARIIHEKKILKLVEFGTFQTGTAHIVKSIFPRLQIISVDWWEPATLANQRWKEILPDVDIDLRILDINTKGEELLLKECPDMLLIDYEHKGESSVAFANFAFAHGTRFVILHDVNHKVGEASATHHLVKTLNEKNYNIFKTPYMMGLLVIEKKQNSPPPDFDCLVRPDTHSESSCLDGQKDDDAHLHETGKNFYISYPDYGQVRLNVLSHPYGMYRLEVLDNRTGEIISFVNMERPVNCALTYSTCVVPAYFVPYRTRVYRDNSLQYQEILQLAGKKILIELFLEGLGDIINHVPYIFEFQRLHNCDVEIRIANQIPSLCDLYDDTEHIHFVERPTGFYLRQAVGLEGPMRHHYRHSLGERTCDDLCLEYQDRIYDFTAKAGAPQIQKPYVCIAPTTGRRDKCWNWRGGTSEAWQQVVDWLVSQGYKVVWISKEECFLKNVIDKSGDLPLIDRVTDLTHSEFFIGLSSGLSWLAHGCKKYVFMLIGAVSEWHEFETNVHKIWNRVSNCRGCLTKLSRCVYEGNCILNKNFECTRYLEPGHVIDEIDRKIRHGLDFDAWNVVNERINVQATCTSGIVGLAGFPSGAPVCPRR